MAGDAGFRSEWSELNTEAGTSNPLPLKGSNRCFQTYMFYSFNLKYDQFPVETSSYLNFTTKSGVYSLNRMDVILINVFKNETQLQETSGL